MNRIAFAFCLLVSGSCSAEVVSLRGGDHPGFTRLVAAIPVGRAWQLARLGPDYVIRTGNTDDTFDVSAAFDRIQRDRIAGLTTSQSPGELVISIACDCHATAFQWQPDRVVIDVLDGPAPAGSQFETPVDASEAPTPDGINRSLDAYVVLHPSAGLAEFAVGTAAAAPTTALALPLLLAPPVGADLRPIIPPQDHTEMAAMAGTPNDPPEHISDTEQAIIESFARAAAQGLLDLSGAPAADFEQPEHQDAPDDAEHTGQIATGEPATHAEPGALEPDTAGGGPSSLTEFALSGPDILQPGITSRTSIDRELQPLASPDQLNAVENHCFDEALLDMAGWGDDRDFSAQISERVSALTSELDSYPDGAVEALAQSYIFFGFGREAIQTLKLDGTDSQHRRVLVALGQLVDEEPDPSDLFASQLGCANQAAIWTALARGTLQGTSESERVAAAAGILTLPPRLRGHLGGRLAQIFVDFGDSDAAAAILDSARGQVTADRVETDVTAAEITLKSDGAEAAIGALETLAQEDLRLTPEALVQLINLTLDEGHNLDPGLITLADSMVYEHRGEPIATALIAAQARGLTDGNAFEQAFALLAGDVTPMGADELAGLRTAAILALAERADDAAFLNFAFDDLPPTGNAQAENAVATRLMTLGFADRAAAVLDSPATGANARDRRYLQAEIAVELGDFAEVDAFLGGMSDPRAGEIRARALAAQGDFAAATAAEQVLPGALTDPAAAWRAGEWAMLEHSEDPLLRAASDAVLAAPETLDPNTPLASSRALLDEAVATQDLAGQLLERFAIDPATDPATN